LPQPDCQIGKGVENWEAEIKKDTLDGEGHSQEWQSKVDSNRFTTYRSSKASRDFRWKLYST